MRRTRLFALLPILALASWPAAAAAQSGPAAMIAPADAAPQRPHRLDVGLPRAGYGVPPGFAQDGLIAAVPIARGVQFAVGRFAVMPLARPRTHTESERRPADVRRGDRGIAAVGFSFSF